MDPDKQSLHLPAFGKDRKTSFLSFSSLGAVVLIQYFNTKMNQQNYIRSDNQNLTVIYGCLKTT